MSSPAVSTSSTGTSSTRGRSTPRRTSWPRSTTTSCPGCPDIERRSCSVGTTASSSVRPATSPGSSIRRARRPDTGRTRNIRWMPRRGRPARPCAMKAGGRTGRAGSGRGPVRWSPRPPSSGLRPSLRWRMRPAPTYANEREPGLMAAPGRTFVDALGHRIQVHTDGTGRPLLLLNGLDRSLDSWSPLLAELADRATIAFDPPGVGASAAPALPLTVAALARIACAVLDAVGVPTADILGFSYGGVIAQQLAAITPDRVRRLILVSTACGLGATLSDDAMATAVFGRLSSGPALDLSPERMGGWWWQLPGLATWSAIPLLARIKAPTLVVCGATDRLLPPSNSRLLARRIPGAMLAQLPGGHDLTRDESAP